VDEELADAQPGAEPADGRVANHLAPDIPPAEQPADHSTRQLLAGIFVTLFLALVLIAQNADAISLGGGGGCGGG
jgi:hypothetical protein